MTLPLLDNSTFLCAGDEYEKVFGLEKLREDVHQLQIENKLLARNLHTERYVSKQKVQQTLSDLRGENFRLQRENEAGKARVEELQREVASREDAAFSRGKEVEKVAVDVEKLLEDNENLNQLITNMNEEHRAKSLESAETSESIKTLENQLNEMMVQLDQINELTKGLEEDIKRDQAETASQNGLWNEHNQAMQESQQEMELIAKENEVLNREMKRLQNHRQDIEENTKILKKRKAKIEEECDSLSQKVASDEAKHAVLLNIMKDPPKTTQHAQTESFTEKSFAQDSGFEKDYERGTIVRVIGLGENAKRKFGKDLEIRATSYARHVNLNVKLNK